MNPAKTNTNAINPNASKREAPADATDSITIQPACRRHAEYIAKGIMAALGDELCERYASNDGDLQRVEQLFRICAESDDSQYSWRNALVALTPQGQCAGIAVGYDGAQLYPLRRRFLDEFELMHGYRVDQYMTDETTPDEYYLDSLAVFPAYRGHGIAGRLIAALHERGHHECGKPLGLLVDKTNHRARGLYNRLGFRPDGERRFSGELMDHLLLD